MDIPIDQTWLEVLLLAIVRMTAFLVVAPPFAHQAFPARIKAMLGVGLGLAVSQRALRRLHGPRTPRASSPAVVLELVTGLVLGFLVLAGLRGHPVRRQPDRPLQRLPDGPGASTRR